MKNPIISGAASLAILFCISGCNEKVDPIPVSISASDLVGIWRSEDYLQPAVLTVEPDLTYDIALEKPSSVSLSGISDANMMLGMVVAHPAGYLEIESTNQFTFFVKREDQEPLPIPALVTEATTMTVRCVLGDSKNAPVLFTRQGEQGGAEQPATALESKPEGKEEPKPESEERSQ